MKLYGSARITWMRAKSSGAHLASHCSLTSRWVCCTTACTNHQMSESKGATPFVSCFGKKKTATAVAHAREGKGLIRLNGQPLSLVTPETLRIKAFEPVLVVGEDKFAYVS